MPALMIPCPECGKKHRAAGFEEALERCRAGREKREAREAKRQAELERRAENQRALPPVDFVQRAVTEGVRWDSICKQLKDNYPPPAEGEQWTLYDVVRLDSIRFDWPTDVDTITLLRLEKIHSGEYLTIHPLALPIDGSFSMLAEGGRDLQVEINWAQNVKALGDAERKRRRAA